MNSEMTDVGRHRRMIGVALAPDSTDDAIAALRDVSEQADIAELRLDLMPEYDLPRILADRPCPVIVTNRAEREGGRFSGSEEERVRPLLEAISLGAEFVDIEHDAVHLIGDRGETRLIVSHHDFTAMPPDLRQLHRDLSAKGADVVKTAGMAGSVLDSLRVLEALAESPMPAIVIAMGEYGLISRLLSLRYESCVLTYASLDQGEPVAPGQLSVSDMRDVYHAQSIGPGTKVFGVLDTTQPPDSLLRSLNAETRRSGIDGVWVPFTVPADGDVSPADVITAYRRLDVQGYLVEEPLQSQVSDALDEVSHSPPDKPRQRNHAQRRRQPARLLGAGERSGLLSGYGDRADIDSLADRRHLSIVCKPHNVTPAWA